VPTLGRLVSEHGAPVAFHGVVVACDETSSDLPAGLPVPYNPDPTVRCTYVAANQVVVDFNFECREGKAIEY